MEFLIGVVSSGDGVGERGAREGKRSRGGEGKRSEGRWEGRWTGEEGGRGWRRTGGGGGEGKVEGEGGSKVICVSIILVKNLRKTP